ncbi:MAG: ABC transporter ATP-binding protein [Acidimicrobiia bacterium]|nr:MAG: ABC transporter ATP-binding protein [Acidimicrobiia bacterium]
MTSDPAFVESPTIEISTASKWFGQKVAVSNLSCSFGPGVTGLLGPNGAGKTTLLRMVAGLIRSSNGTIRVLGEDPRRQPRIFSRVALVPDEDAVYGDMTARRFVRYSAQLANADSSSAAIERTLDEVAMRDAADRPIAGYSKGMRQRTKVAAALACDPEVLILDEPLNGTDPVQRAHLIDLFQRLGERGRTVIVSSHVLEEVERVSSRVVAIVDGRLAAAGTVDAIRAAMYDIPYVVRIDTNKPRELGAAMFRNGVVDTVEATSTAVEVRTRDLARLGSEAPSLAASLGAQLTGFHPQDASLESVFRYLVERR